MPEPFLRLLNQRITRWPKGDPDGFGGHAFGGPTQEDARWQEGRELIRDDDGREVTSHVQVLTLSTMGVGDKIALGEHDDAQPIVAAREIRQVAFSPLSHRGDRGMAKAWL